MSLSRQLPTLVLLVALLGACSAPVSSPTAGTSVSGVALPTQTPVVSLPAASASEQPSPSAQTAFPSMPGLSFDATQGWANRFQFTCQTGLFPPNRNDELLVALCTRQSPGDNAKVDLTIQYWPNDTVLAISTAVQPITGGSTVRGEFRTAFLQWASGLPYGGADPGAVLDWLLANEDCKTGCTLQDASVSWTRTTATGLDAVSAFVPE